jgi:hypothetical protein
MGDGEECEMGKKGKGPDRAAIEGRRTLVAKGMLGHKSIRQIMKWIDEMPARQRPKDYAQSTIGRDMVAIRREWARVRVEIVDALVDEELARLNALAERVWEQAMGGKLEAVDRVLAIQRQRVALVSAGEGMDRAASGGLRVPLPARGQTRVQVDYVGDWREVLNRLPGE